MAISIGQMMVMPGIFWGPFFFCIKSLDWLQKLPIIYLMVIETMAFLWISLFFGDISWCIMMYPVKFPSELIAWLLNLTQVLLEHELPRILRARIDACSSASEWEHSLCLLLLSKKWWCRVVSTIWGLQRDPSIDSLGWFMGFPDVSCRCSLQPIHCWMTRRWPADPLIIGGTTFDQFAMVFRWPIYRNRWAIPKKKHGIFHGTVSHNQRV